MKEIRVMKTRTHKEVMDNVHVSMFILDSYISTLVITISTLDYNNFGRCLIVGFITSLRSVGSDSCQLSPRGKYFILHFPLLKWIQFPPFLRINEAMRMNIIAKMYFQKCTTIYSIINPGRPYSLYGNSYAGPGTK